MVAVVGRARIGKLIFLHLDAHHLGGLRQEFAHFCCLRHRPDEGNAVLPRLTRTAPADLGQYLVKFQLFRQFFGKEVHVVKVLSSWQLAVGSGQWAVGQ